MQKIILEKLEEIEKRENVRILHCVESGSRAWGFASPDSDYDVRFIYVRPREFYLRLDKTRDVIEWQLDDTLDINGWDIKKVLSLLHKSNPTVFEWKSSPIVYKTTEEWGWISKLIEKSFVPKSGIYHYLSTAKGNYREYINGESVRLKKYFYVLRPLLACKWILDEGTPPPMEFYILKERYLEGDEKADVERLLDLKMNSPEITTGARIARLNDYIDEAIAQIDDVLAVMPKQEGVKWSELNAAFLKMIG